MYQTTHVRNWKYVDMPFATRVETLVRLVTENPGMWTAVAAERFANVHEVTNELDTMNGYKVINQAVARGLIRRYRRRNVANGASKRMRENTNTFFRGSVLYPADMVPDGIYLGTLVPYAR